MEHLRRKSLLGIAVLVAAVGVPVAAAGSSGLEDLNRNLPLELEDARPADAGSVQLQLPARTERSRSGEQSYELSPQIQFGFSPRGHLQASVDARMGAGDKSGSGDLRLGALYRFWGGSDSFQAAAIAELTAPSGAGSAGLDSELGLVASQPLGDGRTGVHASASWLHNAAPGSGEREHGYRAVVGAHRLLSERWGVLIDAARIEEKSESDARNLLEAGAIVSVTPSWIASLGASAGLGAASPEYRVSAAVQVSMN